MAQVLLSLILLLQFVSGLNRIRLGMGIFIGVFIIFPYNIPFISLFDLNFVRCSVLLAFINVLIYNLKYRRIKLKTHKRYFLQIFIFSLFLIPSFTLAKFSDGVSRGLYLYFNYYFLEQFLPGILVLLVIKDRDDFYFFVKCIAYAVLIMGTYGIVEFLIGKNPFQNWIQSISIFELVQIGEDGRYGFARRVQSTNWHPIAYGGFLVMYIIMFYIIILSSNKEKKYRKIKSNLYMLIALAIVNIILTASRTPWLAAAFSFTFLIIYYFKQFFVTNFKFKSIVIILIIPIVIYVVMQVVNVLSTTQVTGSSFEQRTEQFDFILSNLGSSYFIGFGPYAIDTFYKTGQFQEALGFESIFFVFLVNYGLLGVFGITYLYIANFRSFRKRTFYSGFFYAIIISHIICVMISGEIKTFRVYWLIYSMLYIIHQIELKSEIKNRLGTEDLEEEKKPAGSNIY